MYLHEDKEQFVQAVNLASYQFSVMESIVEKDYYVTMLLRLLAERIPSVVFKGGNISFQVSQSNFEIFRGYRYCSGHIIDTGKKENIKIYAY